MRYPRRPVAFIIAATDSGPLIVSRFDYHLSGLGQGFGVGYEILESSSYAAQEVSLVTGLLQLRRRHFGDGVVAIDCGANIGVHTVEWAKAMTGWGSVLAIEAQERIFYVLAGNITINNCFNARAINAAVGARSGEIEIPTPDYLKPGSFGSLEIRESAKNQDIGQTLDLSASNMTRVKAITLDSLSYPRIDLLKVDVEGMEMDVLAGAKELIAAQRPIIVVEWIKSPKAELSEILSELGYTTFEVGMNVFGFHKSDPTLGNVQFTPITSTS